MYYIMHHPLQGSTVVVSPGLKVNCGNTFAYKLFMGCVFNCCAQKKRHPKAYSPSWSLLLEMRPL